MIQKATQLQVDYANALDIINALREERDQLKDLLEKDSIRTKEHNILVQENRQLKAQLEQAQRDAFCQQLPLEKELTRLKALVEQAQPEPMS